MLSVDAETGGQGIGDAIVSPVWPRKPEESIASIYNDAGRNYSLYADGNSDQPFVFGGEHGYADRRLWACIEQKLVEIRRSGATSIRILDAGCGPGTWLRRTAIRARELGFTGIDARGFDISDVQVSHAKKSSLAMAHTPGIKLYYAVGDLLAP